MATDDEDEITSKQITDDNGKPVAFASIHEAAAALRQYLDADGVIELHAEGCDGERGSECPCGVEILTAAELYPKVSA
jgi:hypothetical protein